MLESLIRVGAFDSLGSRAGLLAAIDRIVALSQAEQRSRESGQTSMFDMMPDSPAGLDICMDGNVPDVQPKDKIAWEKELTGVFFSPHPVAAIAEDLEGIVTGPCAKLGPEYMNKEVVVAGLVTTVRQSSTREGKPFVVAEVEDESGSIEITVWPRVHETTAGLWNEGAVIIVKGQLRGRGGQSQISCQSAQRYVPSNGARHKKARPRLLTIELRESEDSEADIALLSRLLAALKEHKGDDHVGLVIVGINEVRTELDMPELRVQCSPELERVLVDMLPDGAYRIV